jgi:hypothetical protein
MINKILLAVALSLGAAIAYVDSRPRWDDTGITAAALVLCSGILGAVGPSRPWLWALAVGLWIPLHALYRTIGRAIPPCSWCSFSPSPARTQAWLCEGHFRRRRTRFD